MEEAELDVEYEGWTFYINGEEVDVSRAVDEYGALHWPFRGAKKGDLCTAKSPSIFVKDGALI